MITPLNKKVQLDALEIQGETFYKIENYDAMNPFFMSIVSDTNHWLFISSNGGLTAGRKNSDYSLFPYYTEDKLRDNSEVSGSKTIVRIKSQGKHLVWEPFSNSYRGVYGYTRNLYKSEIGNKLIFQEVNHDLDLTFECEWNSSAQFGFVRKARIINSGSESRTIDLLDGIQNILPYGVGPELQNTYSNLVDAYKKSELMKDSGLGIYALSAIIVDRAEPSEALKANTVWSSGLDGCRYLISSLQLDQFREGFEIKTEEDVRAERGAYFQVAQVELSAGGTENWMQVANVNAGPSQVANLHHQLLKGQPSQSEVFENIEKGSKSLSELVASADGIQCSADSRRVSRHFANSMFNIMRGGVFDNSYAVEKSDFLPYLQKASRFLYQEFKNDLNKLPEETTISDVRAWAQSTGNDDLIRLAGEYLPLKFSRRHGDPSRPWNRFSINTQSEKDGSKILDYQGNWRDIFQNWEALAFSFPEFIDGMIYKFFNATTFDGYNPYRVTKDGFDWEIIEPNDPWSYIGYWGDHQIIYLLKFLEFSEDFFPGTLQNSLNNSCFVYAHVPYKIKEYKEIVRNPKDTILFDEEADTKIRKRRDEIGADGALLQSQSGSLHRVNLAEKLLATFLAKCSNLVPEGGIWMNTQRPEWNDANNALVGNGLSMVTLYYLRRFAQFMSKMLAGLEGQFVDISVELLQFYQGVENTLSAAGIVSGSRVSNEQRRTIMDGLGEAASEFRAGIYANGFSGAKASLGLGQIQNFCALVVDILDQSIEANKRQDGLYHAYNLITLSENSAEVSYLSEMLEGQVAVLSSGYLQPEESLAVLDALKGSSLFREDQYSYILYPNKNLARFLDKNTLPSGAVEANPLLSKLIADGNTELVNRDAQGEDHFNGDFNNADSVDLAMSQLPEKYSELVKKQREAVLVLFEEVFNHKAFTGRSGTFFGYEGLGSIYWHMVSKLLLAAQECCYAAYKKEGNSEVTSRLIDHYYEILAGIGADKSPELYGAFPTDPYSHTPSHRGAQQPGMTGQVKEDVIARFGELGVDVKEGRVSFDPYLLNRKELLQEAREFSYYTKDHGKASINIPANAMAFTLCQVPVVYHFGKSSEIRIEKESGESVKLEGNRLNSDLSKELFGRGGIKKIEVNFS